MYKVASGSHPVFTQCTMWRLVAILDLRNVQCGVWWPSWIYAMYNVARLVAILDLRNVQGGVWWPSWIYAVYNVTSGGHPGFTQCTMWRLVAILDLRNVQCGASGGHPGFTQCTRWRLVAILDLRSVQCDVWWPSWIYAMYNMASGGHPGFTQCTRWRKGPSWIYAMYNVASGGHPVFTQCTMWRLVAILDLRNVQGALNCTTVGRKLSTIAGDINTRCISLYYYVYVLCTFLMDRIVSSPVQ